MQEASAAERSFFSESTTGLSEHWDRLSRAASASLLFLQSLIRDSV